jgi:hypothetical protein
MRPFSEMIVNIGAARASETSMNVFRTTQHFIPESLQSLKLRAWKSQKCGNIHKFDSEEIRRYSSHYGDRLRHVAVTLVSH